MASKNLFNTIKGFPKILGFSYTEKLAELKMESCGESI